MSRVKVLSLLLVVVLIGSSQAVTDCTGLTEEYLSNCTLQPDNYFVVPTKSGPIGGSSSYAVPAGREFWYFKGIPYAQPPVGKLRMRNPVKVKPWTTTRWCLQHGSACIQNVAPPAYVGQEDCLTLNIYVPKGKCSPSNRCPVIFVVHQSNFYTGNGNSDQLGPDRFVGEDVVMVVVNYRLAAFGFSNSGDQNIQGNFGIMDQIMALLWVQDNILAFGGERAQVTLAGDGASLCYHCTAEFSRGLFSGVIVQSSSTFSGWAFQPEPQKIIKELAEGMNLTYSGMPDLAEQLRNAPIQDILLVSGNMRRKSQDIISLTRPYPFLPAVDSYMPSLVPAPPRDFMEILLELGSKICHGVNIITGSTIFEGGSARTDILSTPTILDDIKKDKELLVPPVCVNAPKGSSQSSAIGNKLFTYYFSNGVTELQYAKYKIMLSAMNGNIAFARYNVRSGIKVFVYLYSLCSETNYMRRIFFPGYSCPDQVGPAFSDDSPLVYYQTDLNPFQKSFQTNVTVIFHNDRTEADRRLSAQMIRFFVNFARTGNPNGCGPLDPLFGIEWKPVSDMSDIQTMYLDSTLKIDHHAFQNAIDFWETLCTV